MTTHKFWGEVEQDWAGFSSEYVYDIPHFNQTDVEVFLGEETDEDGEDIEVPPTVAQLNEFEMTFSNFLSGLDHLIIGIQQKAFERYQKRYAHHYEQETQSGTAPLGIDSPEKHFQYMTDINYIRVSTDQTLRILIHYELDEEHGMEIKLVKNVVEEIAGVAET